MKGFLKVYTPIVLIMSLFILSSCENKEQSSTKETTVETSTEETSEETIPDEETISELSSFNTNLELANHLYVIKMGNLKNSSEVILASTLQGIVAQTQSQIYIEMNSISYQTWLIDLNETYGIGYEYVDSVWDLLDLFKDELDQFGYVLYNLGDESVNVASTIAGIEVIVAITPEIEEEAINHGLMIKRDVRNRKMEWLLMHYQDQINWNFLISQSYTNLANRDFVVANKGLFISSIQSDIGNYLHRIPNDTPMLGWGTDEVSDVRYLSSHGITTIASDHSWNLSVFAALEIEAWKQLANREPIEVDNKHYVTFIMSDGDNVQWMMGNDYLFHQSRYGNTERGSIPLGWTIAPTMYDLAPSILKHYYEQATENDYLLSGPSGVGYINPDNYPEEALALNARRTNEYFKLLDLDYMTIIGTTDQFINHIDQLSYYSKQAYIKGGFIFANFDRYAGYKGKIWWFDDKPFVSVRQALWDVDDLNSFANQINMYPVSPDSIDGYTTVIIHAWSHTYDDVLEIVSLFDDDIEVVSPHHFMELINDNVPKVSAQPLN